MEPLLLLVSMFAATGQPVQLTAPHQPSADRAPGAELMLEQLRYLGSIAEYELYIEGYSGTSRPAGTDIENAVNLVREFAESGGDANSERPLIIIRNAIEEICRGGRQTDAPGTWRQELRVAQSGGRVVQQAAGNGEAAARLISCDIIYDPDNRQLSVLHYQSGMTVWDLPHLLAPLPVATEGLEMFSSSNWTQEGIGNRTVIRGSPTGSSASMRYTIGPAGDIEEAFSTIGPTFRCASRLVLSRGQERSGDVTSIDGVYASVNRDRIHTFAYTVSKVKFIASVDSLVVRVPSDARIIDLRAAPRGYSMGQEAKWPPELQGHIAAYAASQDAQSTGQGAKDSARRGAQSVKWPLGVLIILCTALVIWAGVAMVRSWRKRAHHTDAGGGE